MTRYDAAGEGMQWQVEQIDPAALQAAITISIGQMSHALRRGPENQGSKLAPDWPWLLQAGAAL
jgi:hypothetical protein